MGYKTRSSVGFFVIGTLIDHLKSPKLQSMNSFELGEKKKRQREVMHISLFCSTTRIFNYIKHSSSISNQM